MKVFVVLSFAWEVPHDPPDGVADLLRLSDFSCVVAMQGVAPTTSDVAGAFGIGSEGGRMGLVCTLNAYYGFADGKIWEKLKTWRGEE